MVGGREKEDAGHVLVKPDTKKGIRWNPCLELGRTAAGGFLAFFSPPCFCFSPGIVRKNRLLRGQACSTATRVLCLLGPAVESNGLQAIEAGADEKGRAIAT